jgi:2-iminobutanoate/2-iminopropanoate deaminase
MPGRRADVPKKVEIVQPENLPVPKGHYSPGVAYENLLFVSGQLPVRPDQGLAPESFADQVRRALGNVLSILRAAGSEPRDLLKVTAYLVGVHRWDEFNAVYAEMLGDVRPARCVVPVPELHFGCLVEIEAIAVRRLPLADA